MKSETYEEFVEKFKPKKTTDDCYTPPLVYEAIKKWVMEEYTVNEADIIRPFYPGKDYKLEEYHGGCVVLDNPPFSILAQICEYYLDRDIKFFLFAPTLTCLSGAKTCMRMNHIICDANIVYENGAVVPTSFVTNLNNDDTIAQTAPDLVRRIKKAVEATVSKTKLPKYEYPDNVLTAAMMQKYSRAGVAVKFGRAECARISKLDSQKLYGKSIFGGGLLLSTAAAKKKNETKQVRQKQETASKVWELSQREKEMIKQLDNENEQHQTEM